MEGTRMTLKDKHIPNDINILDMRVDNGYFKSDDVKEAMLLVKKEIADLYKDNYPDSLSEEYIFEILDKVCGDFEK